MEKKWIIGLMSFGSIGTPVWCSTTIEREITLDGQRWTYIDDLRLLKFYEGGEGGEGYSKIKESHPGISDLSLQTRMQYLVKHYRNVETFLRCLEEAGLPHDWEGEIGSSSPESDLDFDE